jgi:serine phosphatase RsbU (regulator of sigma subunit)
MSDLVDQQQAATTVAYLDVRGADGSRGRVPLSAAGGVIGRRGDAQILLESTTVSRQHAQLSLDPATLRWRIRDLGSRNGTLVNGEPVTERALSPGDQIQVGNFQLMLVVTSTGRFAVASTATADEANHSVLLTHGPVKLSDDDGGGRLTSLGDIEPPRVATAQLQPLTELSHKLLETADPADRARALCRMMVSPQFHGESSLLLRVQADAPDDPPQTLCEAQCRDGPCGDGPPYVSRTLLRAVLDRGEPALASNVRGPYAPPSGSDSTSNIEMSIGPSVAALTAVACPLRRDSASGALDVLYVTLPPQYGTGEWLALAALAGKQYEQAEDAWRARDRAAEHAALERELERARQIQLRLVPKTAELEALRARGVDLAIGFAPSRWVGGDYVDAVAMNDGRRVLLVIADVCGHGLGAALVTSVVHTFVRAAVRAGVDLPALAGGLSRHLSDTLTTDSYVTMVAIALDVAEGAVECVNAGHPPPLVVAPDCTVRRMAHGLNLPLGLETADFDVQTERLGPGEFLALYSDGLSEQADAGGAMLGIAGLMATLGQICGGGSDGSAKGAARQLDQFLARRQGDRPPDDDHSFILARRL